jgi:predicted RNA-binding Zn ribbon-like protein
VAKDIGHGGGEHLEPGGRAAAPGRLALVQRFINTWNREFPVEHDRLGTTRAAVAWLRDNGLVPDDARVGTVQPSELAALRDLREAIRSLVTANVTGSCDPSALHVINMAAAASPMILAIDDDGRSHLRAHAPGIHRAVATLLAIMHDAQVVDDWPRLKGCRQCGYAFFDRSKNRSATWCSMSICGNRAKNRAYHQRQRSRDQSRQAPPTTAHQDQVAGRRVRLHRGEIFGVPAAPKSPASPRRHHNRQAR